MGNDGDDTGLMLPAMPTQKDSQNSIQKDGLPIAIVIM